MSEVDELATELAEERIAHQKTLEQLREAREQVDFEKHRGATLGGDVQFAEFQANAARRMSDAWQARAEEAEGRLAGLYWLISASVEVTIGVVPRGDISVLRVAVDLEDRPLMWYGDLTECLLMAKSYCESQGIKP